MPKTISSMTSNRQQLAAAGDPCEEGTRRSRVDQVNRDMAHQKLVQQRHQLQLAVATVLAYSGRLAEAVPRILETIGTTLRCEHGGFWIPDAETHVLRCVEAWPSCTAAASDKGIVGA